MRGKIRVFSHIALPALLVSLGCTAKDRESGGLSSGGDASGGGGSGGSDSGGGDSGGSSWSSGSGDGDGDGDSGGSGDGDDTRLDVGSGESGGSGEGGMSGGCEKIDFLFVIDSSASMEDEQVNLINSFPGFMSTIDQTLEAQQYHIMAIATDDGTESVQNGSSCNNGDCGCTPAPLCCERACGPGAQTCNGFDCDNLPINECDRQYGTGKKYDLNGTYCDLADDRRYMLDTQPDRDGTFACIANVGINGSPNEKPMLAIGEALSDAKNDAGGCNEGFLRDDAILVVTLITDEEDDVGGEEEGSPGNPDDWYAAMVAAKGGNPDAVVMLALVGDTNRPDAICPPGGEPGTGGPGAEAAPRLQDITERFQYGVVGSVCAPDYTPFFAEAVSVIDASCEDFVPPG